MTKSSGSDSKNTLYCSFCGKSQHEVRKLIAGPTVFICNECVHTCMEIIRDQRLLTDEPKNNPASFHFSEARIVHLDSDDDFLAIEREMNGLFWQWDACREDDRLLDQYWGLYSIVAKTKPKWLAGAAVGAVRSVVGIEGGVVSGC